MTDYIDLSPLAELLQKRETILSEGSIEEVIDLAREFHINQTFTETTTYYKTMVERIKQRLTKENIDWTTI